MSLQTTRTATRRDIRTAARRDRRRPALIAAGIAFGLVATACATGAAAATGSSSDAIAEPAPHIVLASTQQRPATAQEPEEATEARTAAETSLAAAASVTADIAASGLDIGIPDASVDTVPLQDAAERLELADALPDVLVPAIAEDVTEAAAAVDARVAELRGGLEGALAQKAAEEAAAAAAAEQARLEAEAAAAAPRSTGSTGTQYAYAGGGSGDNSPAGAQATARAMLAERGWGDDQFQCLLSLWNKESGWNYQAQNRSSGAYGIPQALPGSKMASAGADWQTNAATQVAWGLGYISGRYGTPCGAWSHSQSTGWY
ncbi:aggregation-promoting factor C-terminal-like domain-containing protein [Microbacterium sp. GXF7504]